MATLRKNFPGVYTQVIDQSFLTPSTTRFRPGLIGVATKGDFDTPTTIRSLKEFVSVFGNPLTTTVDSATGQPTTGTGYYLADAVSILADLTDEITVVRVGNRYTALATDISGVAGNSVCGASTATVQKVADLLSQDPASEMYVRITQTGLDSSVDLEVDSAGGGTIAFVSPDVLAASYTAGHLGYSKYAGAANEAEAFLYAYSYGSNSTQLTDLALTTFGTVSGTKNTYQFSVQQSASSIVVGGLYKIMETNKNTTHEVRVKSYAGNTIYLETSDLTRVGYQNLALADSYTSGALYRATGSVRLFRVAAKTTGEWANNGGATNVGLFVKVRPGSSPGTKKFEIYENDSLVETFDNLSSDPASTDYYTADGKINNVSETITIEEVFSVGAGQEYHAANTATPWDATYYGANLSATPKSMPVGAVNSGQLTYSGTTYNTGNVFAGGYNGVNAQESDYVGYYDPTDETMTGLKTFEDTDNLNLDIIAAPMDMTGLTADPTTSGIGLMQEMARVAKRINALAICDVPPGLNARKAVDWHNGAGEWTGRGRIDDPNVAVYWNWFFTTDRFTGLSKLVPPTLGTLRCMAFTFNRDKPWYAAAGETRGNIPDALALEYEKVSDDTKQAMYGDGNSINPILKLRGRFYLYGERTLQRAESKLTAVHSVILVNYVVKGLADIGRRYVFDPNDLELLDHIRLAFSEFLDKVKNERGIEEYELVVDERNNTADSRNNREVNVDLAIIPTDVAEKIYINATVRESGAVLNTVGGSSSV